MIANSCFEAEKNNKEINEYEGAKIPKTNKICPACEDYAKSQSSKQIAVMSCEGACLKGEIARQAANLLCHSLVPDKTVRICLGSAFTKDTGQRNLVKNADKIIALEGCFIKCGSRMMQGILNDFNPEIIVADKLYNIDGNLFGINEMAEVEIKAHALIVAKKIVETL